MRKSLVKPMSLAMSLLSVLPFAGQATSVLAEDKEPLSFDTNVTNEGEAIEGGTLKVASVSDTALPGVFNNMYYSSNPDLGVINYFAEPLFGYDENFTIDDSGFAQVEFNQEDKSVKITIPEGVKWHDGEDVTIDDVIYPYYVIADPDYTGIRYGEDFMNVEGLTEYHDGEADEISGLERVDDYTLVVHYKQFSNSMLQAGGGVSAYIEPEHLFKDIPIADQEDSELVRQKPIGFGPFKVEQVNAGEAVTLVKNEDYYRGAPNIDKVTIEVVNPSTIVQELKAGNYDIASLPSDQYETFKDASNFSVLGYDANVYTYIGFNLGTWDAEKGEVVYDDSKVTSNKALRQAMAYAMDNNAVGQEFYHGLRGNANSHIPAFFKDYNNPDQEGYSYDPEKAKQLLADAGFEDKNGDGFVEDPDGNEFTLKFAAMSGGETAEPLAQYYLQAWQAVGINCELTDGKLMEMNSFYERVEANDENIDVYQGAWQTGGDPNPTGLWGRNAPFNYTRFATEENDKLLEAINSDDAFEADFRKQAFYDWQAYFIEEVPAIPTLFRQELTAVNKRVSNYDIQVGADLEWSDIKLLAESPEKE